MAFRIRHLGNNLKTINYMLSNQTWRDLDKFIEKVIPSSISLKNNIKTNRFPFMKEKTEKDSLNTIKNYFKPTNKSRGITESIALLDGHHNSNEDYPVKYMIGMDFNESETPNVIVRNLLENPKWYTAYTPYQAEISQGRLESLFNFQTMVCELTDLPISNCSLLDSASASSEAMSVAFNFHKRKRTKFFCDIRVHPVLKETLKTRAGLVGLEIVFDDFLNYDFKSSNNGFCGVLFSYPDINGNVIIHEDKINEAKETGALLISHNDIMSLMVVKPPGNLGIDISFGTTQRFGLPLWNGGPHSAFFAMGEKLTRYMPGRIVGRSKCRNGNDAYRLALQTREQHIRKEKALSNICTSQALLANTSTMYAIYHGKDALIETAVDIMSKRYLLTNLLLNHTKEIKIMNNKYLNFDRITFSLNKSNNFVAHNLLKRNGYITRLDKNDTNDDDSISLSIAETTTIDDLYNLYIMITSIAGVDQLESQNYSFDSKLINLKTKLLNHIDNDNLNFIESQEYQVERYTQLDDSIFRLLRKRDDENSITGKPFLYEKLFKFPKSETWMLRYINQLGDKDYSLVTGMIPLGSCTMKLNSTSEMNPISWNELQNKHPYNQFPVLDVGYNKMIDALSDHLLAITGLDAINYQSNSGAMGELSGLAVIKAYQRKTRPKEERNVILIPESAHGTNFTSAVLAGFKIKKFKDELTAKEFGELCDTLGDTLAGLMITYPTTYGLFNSDIQEICSEIHEHGGLVYMDGANMNAQSGLTSPGICGADICHLNLHKTFCIPHGGGGPGMGPICVTSELKKYLPSNPIVKSKFCGTDEDSYGTITMSPNSSASILSIPLVYLQTMGTDGIKMATEHAIVNANYLKSRLEPYYKIFKLDNVASDLVGHEFIIDLSEFYKYGITDKDVAKRLIDYNFHPPTMSWPFSKSIMIEPTESENKEELDRFVEAMISIKNEIEKVKNEEFDSKNNPLVNAPHSLDDIIQWVFPYSIEEGLYPVESLKKTKLFPTKSRIDDIWGDKNLVVRHDE
jgi:glycine dehydrogenase